ncbi:hypothetical protein MLD38_012433 [Melastoma candidum]|uniref:Uncharacterized protein n=1 Tax=Melastoma candidum TaxID=119954 RepID=A0ACB9R6C1_9MYRT|nr:hypothetical protein MLD38_012433 [Melastoma candidum]
MRTDCCPQRPASATAASSSSSYNLQRLLDSFTPVLPSQSHGYDINQMWQPIGKETIRSFAFKDLWDSYSEPSAFGARTKVVTSHGEVLNQYYVPYLSALQIYANKALCSPRDGSEGSNGLELESDLWSDDGHSDRLSRSMSDNSSKGCCDSISEDSSLDHPVSRPESLGSVYLEYFEACSPHWRIPLADKIGVLAKDYPALMTLRSSDVSPASWMAVAWYPIYHIPKSSNKDLCACFLTYHTLSSSFLDDGDEGDGDSLLLAEDSSKKEHAPDAIHLRPFGLSTYKMQGDLWVKLDTDEHLKFMEMTDAARSWVKQLGVYHHDLNFFDHRH